MPADGSAEPAPAAEAKGEYDAPTFSPDGRSLYFTYAPQDAEIYHLGRLNRITWTAPGAAEPAPSQVTSDFDRETPRIAQPPDSKPVYLLVPAAGKEGLWRVPAEGG